VSCHAPTPTYAARGAERAPDLAGEFVRYSFFLLRSDNHSKLPTMRTRSLTSAKLRRLSECRCGIASHIPVSAGAKAQQFLQASIAIRLLSVTLQESGNSLRHGRHVFSLPGAVESITQQSYPATGVAGCRHCIEDISGSRRWTAASG